MSSELVQPSGLWKVGIGAIAAVSVLQVFALLIIYAVLPTWTVRGQFGDTFGAINTFFSGLAFAGIIYTILMQRTELSLQREELRLTRQELARSAAAQESSEIALFAQATASRTTATLAALETLISDRIRERLEIQQNAGRGDPEGKRIQTIEKQLSHYRNRLEELYNSAEEQIRNSAELVASHQNRIRQSSPLPTNRDGSTTAPEN